MALQELAPPLPPDRTARELLRSFVAADGTLHVSLSTAWDEPDAWGIMLADIARHVARAYADQGHTEEDVLERVRDLWNAEFAAPTDVGTTSRMKMQ